MVLKEPSILGEMYNVLQQVKLDSAKLVDSSRRHPSGLQDISHDYNRNQNHRSDRTSVQSWRPLVPAIRYYNESESSHPPDRHRGNRHRLSTTHSRHPRRRNTTQRRRVVRDRYYSPTDES